MIKDNDLVTIAIDNFSFACLTESRVNNVDFLLLIPQFHSEQEEEGAVALGNLDPF